MHVHLNDDKISDQFSDLTFHTGFSEIVEVEFCPKRRFYVTGRCNMTRIFFPHSDWLILTFILWLRRYIHLGCYIELNITIQRRE